MTYDGGNSYAYDFQGRPVTVNSTSFIYDAFGRVAEEDVPGTVTHILYQPDGSRFATLQNGSIQNYFMPMVNGMVEVFNASGEQYIRHADWLGSSRLATNPNGNPVYDRAYAPFGETYAETGTADRFFTGNTQDVIKGQTGIYDFLFREHSAGMGRWLSPDPAGLAAVDITNPQTWNRYAYVGNNPLSRIDPEGLRPVMYGEPSVPMSVPWYYRSQDMGDLYGSCVIDGGDAGSCGLFGRDESAVPCPNNVCSGVGTDSKGNQQWVQFIATAGGVSGYYRPGDLTNGIYEYGGKLYDSANYQALLKQVYAPQISAQCGTVGGGSISRRAWNRSCGNFLRSNLYPRRPCQLRCRLRYVDGR